jgi:hypothetical protein
VLQWDKIKVKREQSVLTCIYGLFGRLDSSLGYKSSYDRASSKYRTGKCVEGNV